MKKLIFITLMFLVTSITFSQSYVLKNSDSTITITNMAGKYAYSSLYINSERSSGTDSIIVYTYNPAKQVWNPAKLIDLTLNAETTAGSIIQLAGPVNKVYAFYELYLYGIKLVRTNWVSGNNDNLNIFIKNTEGR